MQQLQKVLLSAKEANGGVQRWQQGSLPSYGHLPYGSFSNLTAKSQGHRAISQNRQA